jgi:hypothetical protein
MQLPVYKGPSCNRQMDKGVRGPWGKWGHHECRGRRGTQPSWQERRWAVGTRQWRLLDVLRMLEDKEDGLGAKSMLHYAQSMYILFWTLEGLV